MKIRKLLDDLTFLVPDLFLVLSVASIFMNLGKYNLIITLSLIITYLSLQYGEMLYQRIYIARQMVLGLADKVEDMHLAIKTNYVSVDGFVVYSDVLESAIEEKIEGMFDRLRWELGEDVANAVDQEKQRQGQ